MNKSVETAISIIYFFMESKKFKTFYNLYSLEKRFIAIVMTIIFLFVVVLARLFYLQIIAGKSLQLLAADEWLRDLPLASKRGEIYDTNGVSLATTVTTYDVYTRARDVVDPVGLANALNQNLGIDYDKAYDKVTNIKQSEVLIKMQVDENIAKELTKFKGVYLSQNVARVYPYSDLLTQVLGYCTIDNVGQAGLEDYYNKYLRGIDGKTLTQTNAQGKEISNSLSYYVPSVAGLDLHTTIDVQIQSILEEEMTNAYIEHDALGVGGIVLDAKYGGILAMANIPNFDLNNVPRSDILSLQQMSKNSCVVDVYEPGSTFKLITLTAALNEGLTTPDEHFYCGGKCIVDGEKIKCWKSTGHGSQTLVEAFKNSCNCVFVQLALRLWVDKYYEYLDIFGIGEKTGIDIYGESSGIVMPKEHVRMVDLARIGFGHAVAVTELQMANVYAKITTGEDLSPHLIDEITGEKTLYKFSSGKTKIKLKAETIEIVKSMLSNNINSEGKFTFVPGYDVGGKTGTAQKYDSNGQIATGKYIASFIGVYPTRDPKYITIICVNEPSNGAYYGGVVAKPVGQRVFSRIFSIKSILPDDSTQLELQANIDMPDLVGMSVADACAKLKSIGLNAQFDSDGEYVLAQQPAVNTKLFFGEIIFLILR